MYVWTFLCLHSCPGLEVLGQFHVRSLHEQEHRRTTNQTCEKAMQHAKPKLKFKPAAAGPKTLSLAMRNSSLNTSGVAEHIAADNLFSSSFLRGDHSSSLFLPWIAMHGNLCTELLECSHTLWHYAAARSRFWYSKMRVVVVEGGRGKGWLGLATLSKLAAKLRG